MRLLLVAVLLASACTRDEGERICPDLEAGDLVVTEVRGPQTDDIGVPYIELYNASSGSIDLDGVRVRFRSPDGTVDVATYIRRPLVAAAGDYVVLALSGDGARPNQADYGFASDFQGRGFLTNAVVDVESCDVSIDRARYDSLPRDGVYSLGAMPPTAEANDLPAQWCTTTMATPQAANPMCPP